MSIFGLLALWIVWLVIAALLLRFTIGGLIDCIKRGKQAPISSWIGAAITVLGILMVLGILG